MPMNFRHRRTEEPEINLIPFIDVLLVVLIFLMLTTTYSRLTELKINLPTANAQAAKDRPKQLSVVVSADEILPRWQNLSGTVRINGDLVAAPSGAGPRWSLGDALAHASRAERLHPGELFATGTLPGGSGIEVGRLLDAGDTIEIAIEGVGGLRNTICREG